MILRGQTLEQYNPSEVVEAAAVLVRKQISFDDLEKEKHLSCFSFSFSFPSINALAFDVIDVVSRSPIAHSITFFLGSSGGNLRIKMIVK